MINTVKKMALGVFLVLFLWVISTENAQAQKTQSAKTRNTKTRTTKNYPKVRLARPQTVANTTKKENQSVAVVSKDKNNIVADRAKMDYEHMVVDSMLIQMGLNAEDSFLPADELYDGQWNNEYVKAYAGVEIPDTYPIDVSEFIMPVEGRINSPFGPRKRRFHYGTDIKLQVGDTVRAAFSGKVRITRYEKRGYGNFIVLRHSNGLETVYGHLSEVLVNQDETIQAGQAIGLGGSTGRSTGPHLHFEFRFLGQAINPEEIIDFGEFCTKDEAYVYEKGKSEQSYVSSKYSAESKNKIKYYRVKQGDTLASIAQKSGINIDKLRKLNRLKASQQVKTGKTIRLS